MKLLVTGTTGFLGHYLLPELLKDRHEVIVLVRSGSKVPYASGFVLGDVTDTCFGIDQNEIPKFDAIVHLAGVVSFSRKDWGLVRKVNVGGTQNAANFARLFNAPLFHVSTAYVCGDFKRTFTPDMLDVGQSFRNEYERSKYDAEKFVRSYDKLEYTIIRPSIIVGDSQVTGLPPLAGYYVGVQAIETARRWFEDKLQLPPARLTLRLKARAEATLNIIPVDIVARQIADIVKTNARGCFHLTNPVPPTMSELAPAISDAVGADIVPQVEFRPNPAERIVARMAGAILPYLQGEPVFDRQSTSKVVQTPCPRLTPEFLRATTERFLRG